MGKRENAGYQHFLLFPQCYQKAFSTSLCNKSLKWLKKWNFSKEKNIYILGKGKDYLHFTLTNNVFKSILFQKFRIVGKRLNLYCTNANFTILEKQDL